MNKATSRQVAEFETTLIKELNRFGAFAVLQFRVPGTNTRLDIYIASPVRAFVEIKFGTSPSKLNIGRLLQQSADVRRKFGGEIVPILVADTDRWRSSPLTQELRDVGYFIISFASSEPAASAARQCAKNIRNFLVHLPYQFKGIDERFVFPTPIPEAASAVDPAPNGRIAKTVNGENTCLCEAYPGRGGCSARERGGSNTRGLG